MVKTKKTTNSNKYQSAIKYLINLVAALMPFFFLPITAEKFEFNKLTLLIIITGISILIWIIQIIKEKEIIIAKTPFNLSGMLFLLAILVSAVFSIDKTSSIFGKQGRWIPSLISYGTLGAFFVVVTSNIKDKEDIKTILYSFVAGSTLATLIGLLSYYGLELLPKAGPFFNPTGSLLMLALIAVVTSAIAFHEIIKNDLQSIQIFSGIVLLLNFFYITLYNKPIIWIFTLVSLGAVFLTFTAQELKEKKLLILLVGIGAFTILGLTQTPITKPVFANREYPDAVKLNINESWDIAISAMRDFPLLGSGPSTFYLNYPRYRSRAMNLTDYWNARFDKPYNEILLVAGTLGLIGIVLGAYFDFAIIKTAAQNLKEDKLNKLLAILTLLMLGTMVIANATVLTSFTLVLFLSLLASLIVIEEDNYFIFNTDTGLGKKEGTLSIVTANENNEFILILIILPLITLAGFGFFSVYKLYPAEFYMQKALELINADAGKSLEYQAKAIRHNPQRSNYYNTYAKTNLALAINLSQKGDLNDTQKEALQNLVSTSIRATKINTESINQLDPLNWEIRADVYKSIRGAAEDADAWAIRSLENAIMLDPTNPRLRVELGGLYFAQGDYLAAADRFRQATNLKTDYANAYYNFAQAVKNLENYTSAKRALELTANLISRDSEDYIKVQEELAELDELIAQSEQIQEDKPTVEELAKQAEIEETEQVTEQEPLTVEGETKEEEILETKEEEEEEEQIQETEEQEDSQE